MDGLERKADDLARYLAELGRQVGRAGVRDTDELLSLVGRVRMALGAVSLQEIGWAQDQVQVLLEALTGLEGRLAVLGRLKTALDGASGA